MSKELTCGELMAIKLIESGAPNYYGEIIETDKGNVEVVARYVSGKTPQDKLDDLLSQEAVAWFTDDHLTDRSATTFDPVVAERWRNKGWPVTKLYAAPVAAAPVVDGRDVRAAIAGIEGSVAVGSDGEWVSVRRTARDAAVTALRNLSSDCAHIYAAYAEAKASTPAAPVVDPSRLGAAMTAFDAAGGKSISYAPAWMRKALEAATTPAAPGIDPMKCLQHTHAVVDKMQDVMAAHGFSVPIRVISDAFRTTLFCQREGGIDASPKGGTCGTCNGHGMIGGLLPAGGGYESEPCPDCSPKGGSDALRVWGTQRPESMPKLFGTREIAELNWHPDEGYDLICVQIIERVQATSAEVGSSSNG